MQTTLREQGQSGHRWPVTIAFVLLILLAGSACAHSDTTLATEKVSSVEVRPSAEIQAPTRTLMNTATHEPSPVAATGVPPCSENTETAVTVFGYVTSGGDTTPEGLVDVPRVFVYTVASEDGCSLDITYTAYPPSPSGDSVRDQVRLDFHAGTIQIGDYLIARGSYDAETKTLTIAEEGDFIETYAEKPR